MNDNLTHIGILIDRSGSMETVKDDTEGGLKTFLDEQAKADGEAVVSLAQFDNAYDLVYSGVALDDVDYHLVPRGMTALVDAMGRFITSLGEELAALDEKDRPGKVIVLILTDGHENASREWTTDKVKELVTQQERDYNWEFVFMGANIDAIGTAAGLGIRSDSAINYAANDVGTYSVFSSASNYVRTTRAGGQAVFSDADRSAAMDQQ